MTCDRNGLCDAGEIAKALDFENGNASRMLLDAADIYRNPNAMQKLVSDVQKRENPSAGDNLEVARDGRLVINKYGGTIEILPIDVTGARIRAGAGPAGQRGGDYYGPGQYQSKEQAGITDYLQRGASGAAMGAILNHNSRGRGAIAGAGGAVVGKGAREATGADGVTGAVVETGIACGIGAAIGGGKDGCVSGAAGSAVGQGLDWLLKQGQKR